MSKPRVFQYLIMWHPTDAQKKEGSKSKIITEPTTILAVDEKSATLSAAISIPDQCKLDLDQLEIVVRPF